jgi:3-oxoadipate enol-lactonase
MAPTKQIQLTSGALHVESNGDPLSRLILCVHGLSANCRSFDRFVPVLAGAGHHVVTMDLRGRGRSEITRPVRTVGTATSGISWRSPNTTGPIRST